MFYDLKSLLQNSLRQKGVASAVEATQVTAIFREVVAELFSRQIASEINQVILQNNTLKVKAGTPALASELRIRALDLQEQLSGRLAGKNFRLQIFG